uniref:Uncharacterized protein n=1 Tax=Trichobilharzia regenti TaxID=157069 RepID=A0AA85KGN7_TRIRE|nr:unnamed protein product [Trichobilharzia regenti]
MLGNQKSVTVHVRLTFNVVHVDLNDLSAIICLSICRSQSLLWRVFIRGPQCNDYTQLLSNLVDIGSHWA